MDNAQPSSSRQERTPISATVCSCWNFASQKDVSRFISLVKRYPKLQMRISAERLLPEWEKLEPITGISAKYMSMKWRRLCDKYRSELRREMITPPAQFRPKWVHFEQMSFVRETEQKRIRLIKSAQRVPPAVPMQSIKLEPVSPPSSPTPVQCATPPKRLVLKKAPIRQGVGGTITPCSSYAKPPPVINPAKETRSKKMIPIEQMPSTGRIKVVSCTKQNILEDLQEQAERVVANCRAVHRVPITDSLVRDAPDSDYDFLMIRIYPLLALFPQDMKRFCYERVQEFVVRMSDALDVVNRKRCSML